MAKKAPLPSFDISEAPEHRKYMVTKMKKLDKYSNLKIILG